MSLNIFNTLFNVTAD